MHLDVVAYAALNRGRLAQARAVHLHPTQLTADVASLMRASAVDIHAWQVNDQRALANSPQAYRHRQSAPTASSRRWRFGLAASSLERVFAPESLPMERALAASLARRLGLAFDDGVVLGKGMNVLVHLRPAPVVARVTRLPHLVRPVTALAGGVGLARHLGGRAVSPSGLIDPGPHVEGGRYVTFWTYRPGTEPLRVRCGSGTARFPRRGRTVPRTLA